MICFLIVPLIGVIERDTALDSSDSPLPDLFRTNETLNLSSSNHHPVYDQPVFCTHEATLTRSGLSERIVTDESEDPVSLYPNDRLIREGIVGVLTSSFNQTLPKKVAVTYFWSGRDGEVDGIQEMWFTPNDRS